MKSRGTRCDGGIIALVILVAGLLAGCGGNNSTPGVPGDTELEQTVVADDAIGSSVLAALPVDGYVDPAVISERRGSVLGEYTIPGSGYWNASEGVVVEQGCLRLAPGPVITAWAMYRFEENLSSDAPWVLGLELADYTTQGIHLCVTDYQGEAWCWVDMGRAGPVNYCGIPGGIDPLSPGGYIYAVVVVEPGCLASISGLTLYRESEAPPPVGLIANPGGTQPDRITLAWEDPAVTYPGLTYEGIAIERTYSTEEWTEIARLDPGTTTFEDIDSAENEYPFDVECRYRLRTVAGGETGVAGPEAAGVRELGSVAHLGATRCTYPDYTRLDWDPVPGADGYALEIYYNDDWHDLVTIESGATNAYQHYSDGVTGLETTLGIEYEYRIRATWEDFRSPEYAGTTGSRGLGRISNSSASNGFYPDLVSLYMPGVRYATDYRIGYSVGGGEIQVLATFTEPNDSMDFDHTYQSPPGMECELDVEYTYYFNPGYNGEFMPWDTVVTKTGYRSLRTPYDLSASDGESGEYINLYWHPQVNSDGIRIYRDGTEPEHMVADLGYCWEWDDYVGDLEEHTYYVQSGWQGHWSDFSEPDTGYRSLILLHEIDVHNRIYSLELTELDGTPAIALSSSSRIHFYHADTPEPASSADWTSHTVDDDVDDGKVSIAVQDGKPILAVIGEYDSEIALQYKRALVASPHSAADWAGHQISESDTNYQGINLTVLDGYPAVSFRNTTNKFARAVTTQPAGSGDWAIMDLETDGRYPAMISYADKPVIACLEDGSPDDDLRLMIGTSAAPATSEDWVSYVVDSASPYCTIGEVAGRLALYYQSDESGCNYGRALVDFPEDPSDWQVSRFDDFGYISGIGRGALLEHNGCPVVCYCYYTQLRLAVAQVPEPAGDNDWTIYNLGEVYYYRVACEINGKLAIAWQASEYGPVCFGYPQQEL